jgi:3-oxoacyl-[acyl-carrier-protein] synthase-1
MVERVVVTGLGIISCLGNDAESVSHALFNGASGISQRQDHIDAGMRSHIAGTPNIDLSEHIDRKQWRFMGDAAGYAYLSLQQAIAQAGAHRGASLSPSHGDRGGVWWRLFSQSSRGGRHSS